jgi:hypothetical protein
LIGLGIWIFMRHLPDRYKLDPSAIRHKNDVTCALNTMLRIGAHKAPNFREFIPVMKVLYGSTRLCIEMVPHLRDNKSFECFVVDGFTVKMMCLLIKWQSLRRFYPQTQTAQNSSIGPSSLKLSIRSVISQFNLMWYGCIITA